MAAKIEKRGENSYRLTVSSGTDGAGKKIMHRKTITAENLKVAEKEYGLFLAEIEKGEISTSGRMTLNEYFDYWERNYSQGRHKIKTIAYNKSLFKRISIAMGHLQLNKIAPKHLLAFYSNLKEVGIRQDPNTTRRKVAINKEDKPIKDTLSANTCRKYHILLHTLLEKATQWQLISFNPASKVEPPKVKKTYKKIYDEETTGKFLLCLQGEEIKYRLMATLALSTGMRKGEIFGLEWRHINIDTSTINIEQSSQYTPEMGIFTESTKTEDSNRHITISLSVMELLRQYKLHQATNRLKLGDKWRPDIPKEEKIIDTERIFTTWNGKPAHPDSFNSWLRKFAIKNNLPHITPHSFRHMAATYLIVAGVDLRTIAGRLGHSNSTTTQLVYSHLVKSAERETADMMENFIQNSLEKAQITKTQATK